MDRSSLTALRRVADVPLLVALAFGLYGLGIWLVVVKAELMPVRVARILAVQRHLAAGAGPTGGVAAFGSSVVLEGVDCAPVRERLPSETRCENLAWTGGDLRQWLLVQPSLANSPPAVLVLGLDLFTLLDPSPVEADRLAVAGWWRFLGGSGLDAVAGVLSPAEVSILRAPRATQLLRFRSFPLGTLNEYVREVARPGLRYAGHTQNFEAPWVRLTASAPDAMQKHLEQTAQRIRTGGLEQLPETERVLELLVRELRTALPGTAAVLVLTPVHPRLVAALGGEGLEGVRRSLRAQAQRLETPFLDHSDALAADGFSDAVHPFGAGRTEWSRRIGVEIAPLIP